MKKNSISLIINFEYFAKRDSLPSIYLNFGCRNKMSFKTFKICVKNKMTLFLEYISVFPKLHLLS